MRRSARSKTAQPENAPTTLDVEPPVTTKGQQTRSNAKGKGQRAAPKAKVKSMTAGLHAPAIDVEVELEPPSSTQSAPRKRGRPKGQGASEDPSAQVVEPVEMKQKETLQPATENLPTKTKKLIPPRSPLPQRINRVIQPGKPAMPRPKRTSAEVAEAEAEKAELLQRLEELDKQKKVALAEMELDEEEEDMEDERTTVRHLKDLQDAESEEVVPIPKDDRLEDFQMDEDEHLMSLDESLDIEDDDSEPESVKTKPKTTEKKKKAARGETREAVEAEKTRLREERQKLKRPAENNEDNKTEVQLKRLKETATKPSGLAKGWQTKGISQGSWKGRAATPQNDSTPSKHVLGGLADEDLESQRPSSKGSKGRDVTRKNEARSDSEADSMSKKVAVRPALGKQRKSHLKLEVTESQLAQPRETLKPDPSFDGDSNASSSKAAGSVKSESIEKPLFVLADWATRFLPTLYHVLFCSEKPFHEFSKGSAFAATVQKVLDIIHPGNTYIVTTQSKIYTTAYDRIVEKRSDFGTQALRLVERLFNQGEFNGNPSAVAKYAKWATREDGPALWRVPSAEGSSPRDDNYIKAQDLFESQFIVELLTWAIKRPLENSELVECGHPKGAVALAAAGIERAFQMFHSGQKIRSGTFSRESHGSVVADYMENLNVFSERRWKSLLTACGVIAQNPVKLSNASSLDRARHALYVPSSP